MPLRRADEWEESEVPWVMPGFIPLNTLTMVVGMAGTGKSTLLAWMAALLSRGETISPAGDHYEGGRPQRIWWNTREDDCGNVVRPRLQAAGAVLENIVLSDTSYAFPTGLGEFRDNASAVAPDFIILDSLQMHFENMGWNQTRNKDAIEGLLTVAKSLGCGIVLIHHFNKGKHPTISSAIGGQGIFINQCKAIYVFGHLGKGSVMRGLAPHKLNFAKFPRTLHWEMVDKDGVGMMDYAGPVDYTADDIYDFSQGGEHGSGVPEYVQAAARIREYFKDKGWQPQKSQTLMEFLIQEGKYFSKGTHDRARKAVNATSLRGTTLRQRMGEEYLFLSEEDKRATWVVVDPPADEEEGTPRLALVGEKNSPDDDAGENHSPDAAEEA